MCVRHSQCGRTMNTPSPSSSHFIAETVVNIRPTSQPNTNKPKAKANKTLLLAVMALFGDRA